MSKDEVFHIIKKNIKEVLFDIPEESIEPSKRLKDLGANSIDRADIIMQSLEDLDLKIPLIELGNAGNINGLVDILYQKLLEKA